MRLSVFARKRPGCFGFVLLECAVILTLLIAVGAFVVRTAVAGPAAKPTVPPTPVPPTEKPWVPPTPPPEPVEIQILTPTSPPTPPPTATPEPPSLTPTATSTPQPTSTPTPSPMSTSTPAQTPSPTATSTSTPAAPPSTTGRTTTALLGAALPLFGGGVAVIGLALLSVSRAIRGLQQTYRHQKALELEQLQAQALDRRRRELGQILKEQEGWARVVQQLLVDAQALNPIEATSLHDTVRVSAAPPHFLVRAGTTRFLFTTDPDQRHGDWDRGHRRERVVSLDAALSPAARLEAQALWEHFAQVEGLQTSTLPRGSAWHLILSEVPDWRPKQSRLRQFVRRITGR